MAAALLQAAGGLAAGAGAGVAGVRGPLIVMAVRGRQTRLPAARRPGQALCWLAGTHGPGDPAGAGGLHRGLAGVAGPPVTPRQALVVLTTQGFTAHLFTWRAGADTALLVALVPLAVAGLLALELAGEGLGALHLLLLGAAPALLHLHLEAGGAAAAVAPLGASVAVTAQGLPAGVSTGGGGLCAGQPHHRLATGAGPVERERTWRTGSGGVADEVT